MAHTTQLDLPFAFACLLVSENELFVRTRLCVLLLARVLAMGSDAHDASLFLPFTSALYGADDDDAHVFEPLVLDDDDDRNEDASDNTSELVPLLELVSAEDVERVYAQALDSDDNAIDDLHTQQLSLFQHELDTHESQQQQLILATGHSNSPTSSVTAPPTQPTSGVTARYLTKKELSGKKMLKSKANKARDERRSELIYLRKKVSELEAQLRSVQSKRPRLTAADASSNNSTSSATNSTTSELALSTLTASSQKQQRSSARPRYVAHAWEDIASRQSEERVKAERENIRLRLVLENQLKIAKSLERILNKKSTAKVSLSLSGPRTFTHDSAHSLTLVSCDSCLVRL